MVGWILSQKLVLVLVVQKWQKRSFIMQTFVGFKERDSLPFEDCKETSLAHQRHQNIAVHLPLRGSQKASLEILNIAQFLVWCSWPFNNI